MITFDEKTVGVWFCPTLPTQDWMATIRELEPNAKYELTYRFRYYNPESKDPWDGKDEKNWYKGTINADKARAIAGLRAVGEGMVQMGAMGPFDEVLNNGDFDDFMKRFMAMPWVYAKQQTSEEPTKEANEDFGKFMKSIGADGA